MDWRPVQGVPRLSPDDCWDRLHPPCDLTDGLSGRKWMDGWIDPAGPNPTELLFSKPNLRTTETRVMFLCSKGSVLDQNITILDGVILHQLI